MLKWPDSGQNRRSVRQTPSVKSPPHDRPFHPRLISDAIASTENLMANLDLSKIAKEINKAEKVFAQ